MKIQKIVLPILLAILLAMPLGMSAVSLTHGYFTTNYTVGGYNYTFGGATITLYANVTNAVNTSGILNGLNLNVSVQYRNVTNVVVDTIYLLNATATGNGTWSKTWVVTDKTDAASNFTFIANDSSGQSADKILPFRIDATDPSVASVPSSVTGIWRERTGYSKAICWNISDNVAESYSSTFDFTSVPSGSALTDNVTARQSGGTTTNNKYCYTLVPDKYGSYVFRVTGTDNVTNTVTGDSYTIQFLSPRDEEPEGDVTEPSGLGGIIPTDLPGSLHFPNIPTTGVIGTLSNGVSSIVSIITGIINGILGIFK